MSEAKEMWDKYREGAQKKRQKNTKGSTEILKGNGINFVAYNKGVHLFVEGRYDFWPSTGLWMDRQTGKKKRGVFNLIKEIKKGQL